MVVVLGNGWVMDSSRVCTKCSALLPISAFRIDHIRPLSSFDLTDHEQVKQVCHYSNLRPLWAIDNLSKGSKVGGDLF